jgi:hypothetical protein
MLKISHKHNLLVLLYNPVQSHNTAIFSKSFGKESWNEYNISSPTNRIYSYEITYTISPPLLPPQKYKHT